MRKATFAILLLLSISSCHDNTDLEPEQNFADQSDAIVLKERDPDSPWISSDYESVFSKESWAAGVTVSVNKLLGYSFRNAVYPLEDMRNPGHPVVDVKKVEQISSDYLGSWDISSGDASYCSYSSFDRYSEVSTITDKVSGGLSIDLGMFSIGAKHAYSSVFSKQTVQEKRTVFGELSIVIRDINYRMQISSNITGLIREKCLKK